MTNVGRIGGEITSSGSIIWNDTALRTAAIAAAIAAAVFGAVLFGGHASGAMSALAALGAGATAGVAIGYHAPSITSDISDKLSPLTKKVKDVVDEISIFATLLREDLRQKING